MLYCLRVWRLHYKDRAHYIDYYDSLQGQISGGGGVGGVGAQNDPLSFQKLFTRVAAVHEKRALVAGILATSLDESVT